MLVCFYGNAFLHTQVDGKHSHKKKYIFSYDWKFMKRFIVIVQERSFSCLLVGISVNQFETLTYTTSKCLCTAAGCVESFRF